MTYCTNASCPAQIYRLLAHFASRGGMDIDGIASYGAVDIDVSKEKLVPALVERKGC